MRAKTCICVAGVLSFVLVSGCGSKPAPAPAPSGTAPAATQAQGSSKAPPKVKPEAISAAIAKLSDSKQYGDAVNELVMIGAQAVPELIKAARGKDDGAAKGAFFALSLANDLTAYKFIEEVAKDAAAPRRSVAIARLGAAGRPEALAVLEGVMKEPDETARLAAVTGFYFMQSPSARAALVAALVRDKSPAVRSAAASSLGQLREKTAKDALTLAVKDTNQQVAEAARLALKNLEK